MRAMDVMYYMQKCLLPKLSKNFDESDSHEEYEMRNIELQNHFELLLNGLKIASVRLRPARVVEWSAKVMAAYLILYKELLTKGPWHSDMLDEYAQKLSAHCKCYFEVTPENILKKENYVFLGDEGVQVIFDECMRILHSNLSANEFKKHPSLIEVYCSIIEGIKEYNDIIVEVKIMPVSLYLIDDFNPDIKKKGLKCCSNILRHLTARAFEGGNYYEVIYASLKKVFMERDMEITRLVLDCLQELLRVADSDFKLSVSDELFANVLEQIQTESSLYRKAAMFRFLAVLIQISGVMCVNKKSFQSVVSYNLDICCKKGVDDIMLLPVVLCFEEWLKHCWCVWRLSSEGNVLSILLKVLYTCKEKMVERIVKITGTLISLSTKEESQKITKALQEAYKCNERYKERLVLVNKYVNVN